jgi:predicted amidohydrolase
MPLEAALRAATEAPARALGRSAAHSTTDSLLRSSSLGALAAGRTADLALLRLEERQEEAADSMAAVRTLGVALTTRGVWRAGERVG